MTTVMVIDNSQSNLSYMELLIKREGWRAVLLRDMDEARQALQTILPDLIILDLLPPGNIYCNHLLSELKQNTNTQHIPLVCITAATEVYTAEQALACGCDAYLGKPFSMEQWRITVMAQLSSHT